MAARALSAVLVAVLIAVRGAGGTDGATGERGSEMVNMVRGCLVWTGGVTAGEV